MRSSKSRSRNKSNRQRTLGNVVNRVFDSSGPEGKVRGTPQQIIEKYLMLARDAQLSNDRVAEQSFFQHAEHYTRMLGEAQREQAERQSQQTGYGREEDDGMGHASDGQGQHGHQNGYLGGQNGNHSGNQNGNQRQDRSDDRGENRGDNRGDNRNDNRGDNRGDNRNENRGENRNDNRNDNRGENRRDNRNENRRDNRRDDRNDNRNENRGDNRGENQPAAIAPVRSETGADDAPQGLPPVIARDDDARGPVHTPESIVHNASSEQSHPVIETPAAPSTPDIGEADLAAPAAAQSDEAAPAPRRRTRAPAAAGGAPRARRKPAADTAVDTAAEPEKTSGE